MTGPRTFYKTRIVFDVLSEEPIHRSMGLADIIRECDEGSYVGLEQPQQQKELTEDECRGLLIAFGSTPEFFQIEEDYT